MEETDPSFTPRDDVKPLHILQPEGVSFKMNGHILEWQKWKMHIGKHPVRSQANLTHHQLSATEKAWRYQQLPTTMMERFDPSFIVLVLRKWWCLMEHPNSLIPGNLHLIRRSIV